MRRVLHRTIDRRALLRLTAFGLTGAAALHATGTLAAQEEPELDVPVYIPPDVYEDEPWVAVNLSAQAAVAMIGGAWVHRAWVTTGKDGWETPEGYFRVVRRVYNETMTSASLGITDPSDQYALTDVLFTQYFTHVGHALHLNYWRPNAVFGSQRTSHGCVGMLYDDAAFLWSHVGMGNRVVVFS